MNVESMRTARVSVAGFAVLLAATVLYSLPLAYGNTQPACLYCAPDNSAPSCPARQANPQPGDTYCRSNNPMGGCAGPATTTCSSAINVTCGVLSSSQTTAPIPGPNGQVQYCAQQSNFCRTLPGPPQCQPGQ